MRGCAELSWHTAANYFPGLDEQAHIQKAKQGGEHFSIQMFAVFLLQSQATCAEQWQSVHTAP